MACTIDTTWKLSGLDTTSTQFTVKARDFDGNLSAASSSVAFPIGTVVAPKTYCTSAGTTATTTIEWIKNVTLNTINNNSTGNNYYQDFSAISTTLARGSSHNLSVSVNAIWNTTNDHDYIVAWIDWNNDSTFADTEKIVVTPQYMTTTTASTTIKVPTTAALGKIRMRIKSVWNGSNTLTSAAACGTETYGEVEDYSLMISAAIPPVATYCATSGNPTGNVIEFVKNVRFNTINNTSTSKTVFYEDFSNIATTVQKKQTYPLIVTLDSVWNANNDHDYIVAWIDWNNDKTFAANERYISNKFVGASKKDTINITIPDSAVVGNVRMRVRSIWNGSNTLTSSEACGSNLWGQVEDYTITVLVAAAPALRNAPTESTKKVQSNLKLTVFPNPTSGIIEIDANTNDDISVEVCDMMGRVVLQKNLSNGNRQMDLSGFTKGIYFIKAKDSNIAILKVVLR